MTLPRIFRLPPTVTGDLRSNILHYFGDIGWWGLYTGGTVAFLNVYAVRCGATPAQIGWLSAAPALILLFISLPAGRLVHRLPASRVTAWGAFFARILFLAYPFLPVLVPHHQVEGILVLVVIATFPNALLGIGFTKLFMEAIPSEWRGTVVGARNAILSIVSFITTILAGQILTYFAFPVGYQVVFAIGFVGTIMTAYHLSHVRPLPVADTLPPEPAPPLPGSLLKQRAGPRAAGRRYIKVIALLFLFNAVSSMAAPIVPVMMVNSLNLSDQMISIGTAGSAMLVLLVSLYIARAIRRSGTRLGTALGFMLLGAQLILLALAHGPALYLVSVAVGGIASGIQMTAQYNYHLEAVPLDRTATWLSWNQMLGNGAVLIGSLLGPVLAQHSGAVPALLAFGVLRALLGIIILRWG
jgi:MFS family permease